MAVRFDTFFIYFFTLFFSFSDGSDRPDVPVYLFRPITIQPVSSSVSGPVGKIRSVVGRCYFYPKFGTLPGSYIFARKTKDEFEFLALAI